MNKELVIMLLKWAGKVGVIMIFIVLACLVTPKIAAWIEKKRSDGKEETENAENAENSEENVKPQDYKVQGLFDASKEEDWDPNYKIYNTDIYGVDFKHGKKQKRKNG